MDMDRDNITADKRAVMNERRRGQDLNDGSMHGWEDRLAANSDNPRQRAMLDEMEARMMAALAQLKPNDREILILRYMEQLDVDEIASVLEISQTAVTSRHLRALQRLRLSLGDETGTF